MWKVFSVVAWVGTLAFALVFSSLAGLSLVLAPAAIFIGLAVGTSARRLSSWTCPRCDAEMIEPEPVSTLATTPDYARPLAADEVPT